MISKQNLFLWRDVEFLISSLAVFHLKKIAFRIIWAVYICRRTTLQIHLVIRNELIKKNVPPYLAYPPRCPFPSERRWPSRTSIKRTFHRKKSFVYRKGAYVRILTPAWNAANNWNGLIRPLTCTSTMRFVLGNPPRDRRADGPNWPIKKSKELFIIRLGRRDHLKVYFAGSQFDSDRKNSRFYRNFIFESIKFLTTKPVKSYDLHLWLHMRRLFNFYFR